MISDLVQASIIPIESLQGEDEEDTKILHEMAFKAQKYIEEFKWCPRVNQVFFGAGVGGLATAFLILFHSKILHHDDDAIWVIVGDIPSAYLVQDRISDGGDALDAYCNLMEDWTCAVLNKKPLNKEFPLQVEPTEKHANMLLSRISFIRKNIIPDFRQSVDMKNNI